MCSLVRYWLTTDQEQYPIATQMFAEVEGQPECGVDDGGETIACTGNVDHGQGAVTQGQVGDAVTIGQRQGAFAVAGRRYEALRGAQYPVFVPTFLRRIAEDGYQRRW